MVKVVNSVLGIFRKGTENKTANTLMPLYTSMVQLHLKYWVLYFTVSSYLLLKNKRYCRAGESTEEGNTDGEKTKGEPWQKFKKFAFIERTFSLSITELAWKKLTLIQWTCIEQTYTLLNK